VPLRQHYEKWASHPLEALGGRPLEALADAALRPKLVEILKDAINMGQYNPSVESWRLFEALKITPESVGLQL
jgi:hypothetical protein